MKIVLVPNPNGIRTKHVPLGLLSVGTALKRNGIEVEIVDLNSLPRDTSPEDLCSNILSRNPQCVGFSAMASQFPRVLRIAGLVKNAGPDIKIILGGPEATMKAEAVLPAFPEVDLIVRGECEHTVVDVVKNLGNGPVLGSIPGITYRNGSRIVHNPDTPLITDLDALESRDYGLLPSIESFGQTRAYPLPVEVGRGCPYGCVFCSLTSLLRRKFRVRSPEHIIAETKELQSRYNAKYFNFLHDNMTVSRQWILDLCDVIERENMDIRWDGPSRADSLDADLIKRLAETGCSGLYFGIETGSQRMQKVIRKNLKFDGLIDNIRRLTSSGIPFAASFIAGFPEETAEDLSDTIRLMMQLRFISGVKMSDIQFGLLCPLMGSPLLETHGSHLRYDGEFAEMASTDLSEEEERMIMSLPGLFPEFYYYPTNGTPRSTLVRLPFLLLNLLYLRHSIFMLFHDESLNFPLCVLRGVQPAHLGSEKRIVRHEGMSAIVKVSEFLSELFKKNGLADHPIHDTLAYDVTLLKADSAGKGAPTPLKIDFTYDVQSWVEAVRSGNFSTMERLPEKRANTVLFLKTGERVSTMRVA
ncbi:MAG: radical SAM protein [Desulfomonilaceae bacterium]|nr:radical SAM protein [Desulfomonilaceae bacterium]